MARRRVIHVVVADSCLVGARGRILRNSVDVSNSPGEVRCQPSVITVVAARNLYAALNLNKGFEVLYYLSMSFSVTVRLPTYQHRMTSWNSGVRLFRWLEVDCNESVVFVHNSKETYVLRFLRASKPTHQTSTTCPGALSSGS